VGFFLDKIVCSRTRRQVKPLVLLDGNQNKYNLNQNVGYAFNFFKEKKVGKRNLSEGWSSCICMDSSRLLHFMINVEISPPSCICCLLLKMPSHLLITACLFCKHLVSYHFVSHISLYIPYDIITFVFEVIMISLLLPTAITTVHGCLTE